MKFKNLKIKNKLTIAFGAMIIILIGVCYTVTYALKEIEKKGNDLTESIKLSDALNEAKYNLTWDKQIIMEILAAETKEDVLAEAENYTQANKAFDENIDILSSVGSNGAWGAQFEEIKASIVKFANAIDSTHNNRVAPALDKLKEMKLEQLKLQASIDNKQFDTHKIYEANPSVTELSASLSELDKSTDEVIDNINSSLLQTEDNIETIVNTCDKETDELVSFYTTNSLIVTFISIILSVVIGFFITKSIVTPVNQAKDFAEKIADGDLTATINIDQTDEMGQLTGSLKKMIGKLEEVIGSITSASTSITMASNQMSSSAQSMSESATEQASSVEEISSSMEEMTANIQQNTNNAKQTEKIAKSAVSDINNSNEAMVKTVQSMKTIAQKISIIGEISRQTNLLALNAAVEAARAGEHGKGFAVVAAEVRKLAERSQIAASEIDQVSATSVDTAEKSGTMLQNVVPHIQKTSDLVQEITASSIEQNSGAEQVNNAIQQLNQTVQENAAAAEEMAASSEELNSQAEQLKEIVSFFKLKNEFRAAPTQLVKQANVKQPQYRVKPSVEKNKPAQKINLNINASGGMNEEMEYERF